MMPAYLYDILIALHSLRMWVSSDNSDLLIPNIPCPIRIFKRADGLGLVLGGGGDTADEQGLGGAAQ